MAHPYRELIEAEAGRSEGDLAAFRSRAISIVTTSSGIITLLTGIVTFAASKAEEEKGVPDRVIALLAFSFLALLVACVIALWVNMADDVFRPDADNLVELASYDEWAEYDPTEQERQIAEATAKYLVDLQIISNAAARKLNGAASLQILGLALAAVAGVVAALSIN